MTESSQNINIDEVNKSRLNLAQDIDGNLTQIQEQIINVTVYDRLETIKATSASSPSTIPLSASEYRQRKILLNKVKNFWIEEVLERSLHHNVLIELGLKQRLDTVDRPLDMGEFREKKGGDIPANTKIESLFADIGEGRTLLILGEPGAGKTTMLCKLAKSLITQTEDDLSKVIPVVFNLSSWSNPKKSIASWLVKELSRIYKVSPSLGKKWIEQQSLLILLDGLDEVNTEVQNQCVQAINEFLQDYGQTEVVVCSRIDDYLALSDRLQLQNAIYLRPLTPEQIDNYLSSIAHQQQLEELKNLLKEDKILQKLAKSPLMLDIMLFASSQKSLINLPKEGSADDRRNYLLKQYVEIMLHRVNQKNANSKGVRNKYPDSQVKHYLSWLAQRMQRNSQTIFFIEGIQGTWLPNPIDKRFYLMMSRLLINRIW